MKKTDTIMLMWKSRAIKKLREEHGFYCLSSDDVMYAVTLLISIGCLIGFVAVSIVLSTK